eukprot:CAMPEP_0113945966 /NCGR_PEP_ID=MMETSP1339-20121228/53383_1 /TAXON_ID=94617 /ORGANISM="Fibrocapsa japonica" /LENGTH=78 /DNA_ID=CAMNT_0000951829 /DNA_START=196 /DNA_END=432 /DNA_ORIENTATION=+ /assembly_acc=CAM_ASM_000762
MTSFIGTAQNDETPKWNGADSRPKAPTATQIVRACDWKNAGSHAFDHVAATGRLFVVEGIRVRFRIFCGDVRVIGPDH